MIPTFIIFLREGVEASMVIAILLSYLSQTNQRHLVKDVLIGATAALVVAAIGGVVVFLLVHQYAGSRLQTIFETAMYAVAGVALTYTTFWMQSHGRSLPKELEERSASVAESGERWQLRILAFTSVGRESLEAAIFTLAIVFASTRNIPGRGPGPLLFLGVVLGIGAALGIAFGVYRTGLRIDMRKFYRFLGVLLILLAAGLFSDAIENLQQLGWVTFGSQAYWNSSRVLSESSPIGDMLHSLAGYAQQPTVLQMVVWVGFVGIALPVFLRRGTRRPAASDARGSASRA